MTQKWKDRLIWLPAAVFTLLYFTLIFNRNIWSDEGFTIQLIQGTPAQITLGTAQDVHPPLYYYYAKLFQAVFGHSLKVQKIAAILPMTATLVLGPTRIHRRFGYMAGLLFSVLLGCLPCSMEFALQVRMYSLALFLVTLCGLCALSAYETGSKKDLVIYALTGVAAAYTHYFALLAAFLIAFFYLAALLRDLQRGKSGQEKTQALSGLKAWGISAVLMIAAYLPWVPLFLKQIGSVQESYWIPPITGKTMLQYLTWSFALKDLQWTAAWYLFLIALVLCAGKAEKKLIGISFVIPVLTAAFGILWSVIPGNSVIYRDQYIFPAMGILCAGLAVGLAQLFSRGEGLFREKTLVLIMIPVLLLGAGQYIQVFNQEYRSSNIEKTLDFMDEHLGENDYIIYNFEKFGYLYRLYFPPERTFFMMDYDFSTPADNLYFLDTPAEGDLNPDLLAFWQWNGEDMGEYGIEHNPFEIIWYHH